MPEIIKPFVTIDNYTKNITDSFGRNINSLLQTQTTVIQDSVSGLNNRVASAGQVSGTGGTATYSANNSSTTLAVNTTTSLVRFRSSRPSCYKAGKGFRVYATFNFKTTGETDVEKRVGYMYEGDGFFVRQNGTNVEFVISSTTSGSPVETTVLQANWNEDTLNGVAATSPSGYDIDWTKAQIVWFDAEWLGYGILACGFVINGEHIVAHVFNGFNQYTVPYCKTLKAFLTWEIERVAPGGVSSGLDATCGAVLVDSSGIESQNAIPIVVNYPINYNYNTGEKQFYRPYYFIRLNPLYVNERVLFKQVGIIADNDASYSFYLIKNPAITGHTLSWTDWGSGLVQVDFGINPGISSSAEITNAEGNILLAGASRGKSAINPLVANSGLNEYFAFGCSFDGTPDIYVIAASSVTANGIKLIDSSVVLNKQI